MTTRKDKPRPEISDVQYVYEDPLYAGCTTYPSKLVAITYTVTRPLTLSPKGKASK